MLTRTALAACLALALSLPTAAAALASDARYEGNSAAGDVAFFSTVDKLVPGDTDTKRDVYERSFDPELPGYVTRQVSFGPSGGNDAFDVQYLGSDSAGSLVFFSTGERLTGADTDTARDLYVRDLELNTTTLVSRGDPSCAGSGCGNANADASAVTGGIAADGARVFFASTEQLAAADTDGTADVYVRDLEAGQTILVSAGDPGCTGGGCGNGVQPAFFLGASVDGGTAFLTTAEKLVSADGDAVTDIYARGLEAETTALVSTAGTCPAEANCTPVYGGASADGSHVFFETKERVVGADEDEFQDVYDWSGGAATLASFGPDGGEAANAVYAGSSADGASVFFATVEPLIAAEDGDGQEDVYVRVGGASTALVSAGDASCAEAGCGDGPYPASLRWVAPDGSAALLSTEEALVETDEDGDAFDVYRRDLPGGPTTLVSQADPGCSAPGCGNGAHDAAFAAASADGTHVFLVTAEALADDDEDEIADIYDRSGGGTARVSTGPLPPFGNGEGAPAPGFRGASGDGTHAFFSTEERLTEGDFDFDDDVYERSPTGTLLVSAGNGAALGPAPPSGLTTDPASPGETTTPTLHGEAAEGATIKVYTTSDCSGEQAKDPGGEPAGGSAAELGDPEAGIAVKVASGSTTTFHATAELDGIVSSCSAGVTYKHESSSGGGDDDDDGSSTPSPTTVLPPAPVLPPATHGGGIPYVVPVSRITFGPAFKTRKRRPVFRFADVTGQPGTRFICRVDRHRWRPCGSPLRLRGLGRGRHVFRVKARNAAGLWEQRSSKRRFKMVRGDKRQRRGRRAGRRARR